MSFNEWYWLWQGSFCLALGLMGSLLLRKHAARAHQFLRLGMLTAILVPVLSLLVQQQGLGVLPPKVEEATVAVVDEPDIATIVTLLDVDTFASAWEPIVLLEPEPKPLVLPAVVLPVSEPSSAVAAKPWSIPWKRICLLIWPVVGLVFLFRLVRTFVLGMRLLLRAQPCDCDGLREAAQRASTHLAVPVNVTIKESKAVESPMIWCWTRRPVLLVQVAPKRSARTDWVGVFCHELAHWKRRDHLSGLWAELWLCLFWWHPLVWWVKRRLDVLSEQACDDWVLAGGRSAPDYAESLLGLIPETRMAFLPTIVGKDKTMKERIVRIIKHKSSNPQVGRSWAILVCLLTSLLVVGTAFAQRRPNRERREERAEQLRHQVHAEHNEELCEALEETQEELEEAVRELKELEEAGEGDSEEANKQRRSIRLLKQRLVRIEQAQKNAGQPRLEFSIGVELDHDDLVDELEEALEEAEEELEEAIEELEELEEEDEGDSEDADELRGEIRELKQKVRELAFKLRAAERRQGNRIEVAQEEVAHEMRELGMKLRATINELRELEEDGKGGSEDAQALRKEIRSLEKKMQMHGRKIQAVAREQQQRQRRRAAVVNEEEKNAIRREMINHQRELRQHAANLERELKRFQDEQPERAEKIHQELEKIHREMERIEYAHRNLEHAQPEPRLNPDDMHRRHAELAEKAEGIHHALEVMGDRSPDLTDRLERELHAIHAQMEDMERAMHEQERDDVHHELDVRVDKLHQKVEHLTDEMQEIKHLLRRLLEREHEEEDDD